MHASRQIVVFVLWILMGALGDQLAESDRDDRQIFRRAEQDVTYTEFLKLKESVTSLNKKVQDLESSRTKTNTHIILLQKKLKDLERKIELEKYREKDDLSSQISSFTNKYASGNTLRSGLSGNTLRNGLSGNTLRSGLSGNTLRSGLSGNTLRSGLSGNTLRSGLSGNTLRNGLSGNTLRSGLATPNRHTYRKRPLRNTYSSSTRGSMNQRFPSSSLSSFSTGGSRRQSVLPASTLGLGLSNTFSSGGSNFDFGKDYQRISQRLEQSGLDQSSLLEGVNRDSIDNTETEFQHDDSFESDRKLDTIENKDPNVIENKDPNVIENQSSQKNIFTGIGQQFRKFFNNFPINFVL